MDSKSPFTTDLKSQANIKTAVTGRCIERFFILKRESNMKFTKANLILLGLAGVIAAGVVWASNNVDAVEDVIG